MRKTRCHCKDFTFLFSGSNSQEATKGLSGSKIQLHWQLERTFWQMFTGRKIKRAFLILPFQNNFNQALLDLSNTQDHRSRKQLEEYTIKVIHLLSDKNMWSSIPCRVHLSCKQLRLVISVLKWNNKRHTEDPDS